MVGKDKDGLKLRCLEDFGYSPKTKNEASNCCGGREQPLGIRTFPDEALKYELTFTSKGHEYFPNESIFFHALSLHEAQDMATNLKLSQDMWHTQLWQFNEYGEKLEMNTLSKETAVW